MVQTLNHDMTTIIEDVRHSLVQLSNGRRGSGSGTIWQRDGLILTNAHVVQRQEPQVTLWNDKSYASRLLAVDERRDLAVLSIEAHDLAGIIPGDSRRLRPGDWVLALGHPWGVPGAVSAGAVIDVGIPLELPRYSGELIQANLQLRPGHSGGPMVDGNGRLIGINTMLSGPYAGLAIPLHVITQFLQEALGDKAVLTL